MGERMSRTKKKIFGMVGICRLSDLDDISGRNDELYSRLFMYPICEEFGFSVTAYSMVLTLTAVVNALVSAFW